MNQFPHHPARHPYDWPFKGDEHDEARGKVETRMKAFVAYLKRDPQFESILRNRQQELGVPRGSRLDQVIRERDIDRAMT